MPAGTFGPRLRSLLPVCALTVLIPACTSWQTCWLNHPGADTQGTTNNNSAGLYVGGGDPYQSGSLAVRTIVIAYCELGAPVPLRVHVPIADQNYPVVLFQHGFMSFNHWYDEILRHLAGHGFVVVAPQMYLPGLPVLLGNPTAAEEAAKSIELLDWLNERLDAITGVHARMDRLGLVGHSRGGKVAWLALSADPSRAQAIAGVDPVDGTGGPRGNQPRVVQGSFEFNPPTLVIGAGLGGACAPVGDNHEQFFTAAAAPAWHVIAENCGHADMLDEDAARQAASFCTGGSNRALMRRLIAGLMTAFFRGSLQADPAAYDYIDSARAPDAIRVEVK